MNEAIKQCREIYDTQITPYMKKNKNYIEKATLEYIWRKFCQNFGIGQIEQLNPIIDRPLAQATKDNYFRCYKIIEHIKNASGIQLVKLNIDLLKRQNAEKIYIQLHELSKARNAVLCTQLLRRLFNYGKFRLDILKSENPFQNMRILNEKNEQPLWSDEEIILFSEKAIKMGYPEISLAVRLNYYLALRTEDFYNLSMDNLKKKNGVHYFEVIPHKTQKDKTKSFHPFPTEIYEEIKDRVGRIINYSSKKTFMKHFVIVKKTLPINQGLNFRLTRNSSSTAYYEAGSSPNENMSILGHKNINTNISIYRQNTPDQAINAFNKRIEKEEKDFAKK